MGILDFFLHWLQTKALLRMWAKKFSQKVAFQIEGKSYWYSGMEDPQAGEGLKGEKNEPAERRKLGRSELCGKQREKNKLQGYR